jgi:hypothetical protein
VTEHEGRWVDIESYSGQDDTAYIACSCGWRSRSIWSRMSIPNIQADFKSHQEADRDRP